MIKKKTSFSFQKKDITKSVWISIPTKKKLNHLSLIVHSSKLQRRWIGELQFFSLKSENKKQTFQITSSEQVDPYFSSFSGQQGPLSRSASPETFADQ
jgi:hypothetical protein